MRENAVDDKKSKGITIYCHFSFKRPKGREYGLFAVAFYVDYVGKRLILQETKKFKLWENQQFVTAIQSYHNALETIQEYQGMMMAAGINRVMLVTHNSILAGWIENHDKNIEYTDYMERAVELFRVGGAKELRIGVGLCDVRDSEKSYKFCREDKVINKYCDDRDTKDIENRIKLKEYKSVLDIIDEDKAIPDIVGITEITE